MVSYCKFKETCAAFASAQVAYNKIKVWIQHQGDTPESMMARVKTMNGHVKVEKYLPGKYIIMRLLTYKGADLMGSPSWCIGYNHSDFLTYVATGLNKQYMIWDLTKDKSDPEWLNGMTVSNVGVNNAHNYNDGSNGTTIKSAPYYKELRPMTPQETTDTIVFYDKFEKTHLDPKYANLAKVANGNVASIPTIINSMSKTDVKQIGVVLAVLFNNNDINIVKQIAAHDPDLLAAKRGLALRNAYDAGDSAAYNIIRDAIEPDIIPYIKEHMSSDPDSKLFIQAYDNPI